MSIYGSVYASMALFMFTMIQTPYQHIGYKQGFRDDGQEKTMIATMAIQSHDSLH